MDCPWQNTLQLDVKDQPTRPMPPLDRKELPKLRPLDGKDLQRKTIQDRAKQPKRQLYVPSVSVLSSLKA